VRIRVLSAVGAVVSIALGLLYATRIEPRWPALRRVVLPIGDLPDALDGLTILHVSDLHARPDLPHVAANVRRVASIADLVCLTGDVGDLAEHADLGVAALQGLRGRLGTFAVLGNHDLYAGIHRFDTGVGDRVRLRLEASGIAVLRNQNARIRVRDHNLFVVGIDDPHTFHDGTPRAYRGVPAEASSVALAHTWEIADAAIQHGAALILAGHTHGGQIRLPTRDALVANNHRRPLRVGGVFRYRDRWVHISPGIGQSISLRFWVRPGASLIVLRRQRDDGAV